MTRPRIFIAGHRGMVGSALCRRLEGEADLITWTREELDLLDRDAVFAALAAARPDVVVHAAARVGGILANDTYPVEFLGENLRLAQNVIDAAFHAGVQKLCFLGSTCIYPRDCPQPIKEEYLLTGPLEKTNEAYAIAKIAGLKLCEYYTRQYGVSYFSVMPTNLYGPGDNYHPEHSHVLPALLRRFHEAKEAGAEKVVIWGSGTPLREFLHADDLADAIARLLEEDVSPGVINVGSGEEVSIHDLARLIADTVGYGGAIELDRSKPDGTPRKLACAQRLNALGWKKARPLARGLAETYAGIKESGFPTRTQRGETLKVAGSPD